MLDHITPKRPKKKIDWGFDSLQENALGLSIAAGLTLVAVGLAIAPPKQIESTLQTDRQIAALQQDRSISIQLELEKRANIAEARYQAGGLFACTNPDCSQLAAIKEDSVFVDPLTSEPFPPGKIVLDPFGTTAVTGYRIDAQGNQKLDANGNPIMGMVDIASTPNLAIVDAALQAWKERSGVSAVIQQPTQQ